MPSELIQPLISQEELLNRISDLEEQVSGLARLESALERNAALFKALLAASRDGITLTRTDGAIICVVQSALGFKNHEVCGMSLLDLAHPDDRGVLANAYQQIAQGRIRQVEHAIRLIRPDGSIAYIQGTLTDMLDDPAVLAIAHHYRDVTPAIGT